MRAILVLLFFAAAFGAAAVWQSRRVDQLQREREVALKVQDQELARSQSGLIPAGWARVVVGRPSGVDPVRPDASVSAAEASVVPNSAPASSQPAAANDSALLGDFEKLVEPGESLSQIARAHYGSAAHDLVSALARYNDLSDENALTVGQKLLLPPLDRLGR